MPRNMSFFHTQRQIKDRSKTVTRRLGWWSLKPGQILNAVEKAQGIPKGGKINKLCQIRILNTSPAVIYDGMPQSECVKEGFPEMTAREFNQFFCKAMGCDYSSVLNRIEFEYLNQKEEAE